MPEFLELLPPAQALRRLLDHLPAPEPVMELLPVAQALWPG